MSSAVRQLVYKIGAIVTIAPVFTAYINQSYAQNNNYQDNGNYASAPSQSSLLLEVQALRKEVAELRNLIDLQAYQLQQIQQQTGIAVSPQQVTPEVSQSYNQFPSAPPSATAVPYNDPVVAGQQAPYASGNNNQQNSLPVVDEVQIGQQPTTAPQGQPDFTKAPTIYPENSAYIENNTVGQLPSEQPPVNTGAAIDANNPQLLRPNVSTTLSEDVLYQQAFANLKDANHQKAVEQFKMQLQTYPNGEYADDALYWIGESSYVNRGLAESKRHFQMLVEQYSSSHRVPDALLKIAIIEKEQGSKKKARELFERVIKQHPKSNAAISARNSLAHL